MLSFCFQDRGLNGGWMVLLKSRNQFLHSGHVFEFFKTIQLDVIKSRIL